MPSFSSWGAPAPCRWRRRALGSRPERGCLAQLLPYMSGPRRVRLMEAGITGPGRSAASAMRIGKSAEVGPAGWVSKILMSNEGTSREQPGSNLIINFNSFAARLTSSWGDLFCRQHCRALSSAVLHDYRLPLRAPAIVSTC